MLKLASSPGQVLESFGVEFASIALQPDSKHIVITDKKTIFLIDIIMKKGKGKGTPYLKIGVLSMGADFFALRV
jgi:hypothetical protein